MATLKTNMALLKAQAKKLECNIDIKDRKYHLKTYKQCFVGRDAILPIINLGFANSESSAIEFGNKLIQAKIIQHVEDADDLDVINSSIERAKSMPTSMEHDDSHTAIEHSASGNSHHSQQQQYQQYQMGATMTRINSTGQMSNYSAYTTNTHNTQNTQVSNNNLTAPPQSVTRQVSEDDDLYEDLYADDYKQNIINLSPVSPITPMSPSNQSSLIQELQSQIQLLSMKYLQLEAIINNKQNKEPSFNRLMTQTEGGRVDTTTPRFEMNNNHTDDNNEIIDKTPKLLNNWCNYGQQYSRFRVYKIGVTVYLQGCLIGGLMGKTICQLPTGCRPSGTMTQMFDQQQGLNGRIRIKSDGKIIPEYMNKTWIYLDGISFIAASDVASIDDDDQKMTQNNKNVTFDLTPKLENGWININGGYTPFKVYKIGNVCYLQGCIKGGNMGSIIAHLSNECRPNGIMTFIFDQQGSANGRLRISNDGTIIVEYMSKNWIYLDGISFVVIP